MRLYTVKLVLVTTSIKQYVCNLYYITIISIHFHNLHFILIKPVFRDHMSYVTLFQCSLWRSHKTGLIVVETVCKLFFSLCLFIVWSSVAIEAHPVLSHQIQVSIANEMLLSHQLYYNGWYWIKHIKCTLKQSRTFQICIHTSVNTSKCSYIQADKDTFVCPGFI